MSPMNPAVQSYQRRPSSHNDEGRKRVEFQRICTEMAAARGQRLGEHQRRSEWWNKKQPRRCERPCSINVLVLSKTRDDTLSLSRISEKDGQRECGYRTCSHIGNSVLELSYVTAWPQLLMRPKPQMEYLALRRGDRKVWDDNDVWDDKYCNNVCDDTDSHDMAATTYETTNNATTYGCLERHLSRAWEIRTFAQWQSLYWQLRRPRRLLQQSFRLRNDGDRRNQGKGTHHGNPVATATAHTGGATRGLHAASPLRSGIYQRRNPMAIYIYIYIHIYSHVCNHIYIYIYIHMYVTIHMVSMHIYIHIHIYINTHMDIKTLSNLVFSTSTPFIWKSSLLRHEMSVSDSSTKFKLLHQYNMTWHFSTRWHVSKVNEVLRMLRIRM